MLVHHLSYKSDFIKIKRADTSVEVSALYVMAIVEMLFIHAYHIIDLIGAL